MDHAPGPPTLLLADAAQVQAGKLSTLGACWNVLDEPAAHVLIALVPLPPRGGGEGYELVVWLLDAAGDPVLGEDPDGGLGPVRASVRLAPEPGQLAATVPVIISLGGLPLAPDAEYTWCAEVDAGERRQARLPFRTGAGYPDLAVRL